MTCCSEPCRYQKDGLCTLPSKAHVGFKAGGCCYFAPLGYEGYGEYEGYDAF